MDKNTSSFDAAGNVSYLPVLPSACPPRLAGLISDDESANSYFTISLGAPWAPTSSWRPFGPAFGPSGLLDFVLRALRALRPCDPRNVALNK